jgi:predicted nucleic acid-binding protein
MSLVRIAFDTSALSALAKGGSRSGPLIKTLNCGFDVWLTAMSVDELISTTDADTREMLIACCQRLLASGRCVWPPHEIVRLLVSAHARNPARFDWRQVDIRARVYERAMVDRDFTNELCVQQLNEQQRIEREFMGCWERLRLKLDPVLAKDPGKRPTSYSQAAEIARSANPNLLWGIGRELYSRVSGTTPSDAAIEAFLDVCPPFRAVCYGLCGSWYDIALAPMVYRKLAGRNDQMMAAYLPYCSRFVTHDKKQLERLRDIAVEAKLDCEVLSYKNFCAGFQVGPSLRECRQKP